MLIDKAPGQLVFVTVEFHNDQAKPDGGGGDSPQTRKAAIRVLGSVVQYVVRPLSSSLALAGPHSTSPTFSLLTQLPLHFTFTL